MSAVLKIALVLAGLTLVLFFFWGDLQHLNQNGVIVMGKKDEGNNEKNNAKAKKDKKDKGSDGTKENDKESAGAPEVKVLEKWVLPSVLAEVSGIAYLDKNVFACIQDEAGTIFIFNTATGKVEKEVPFAGVGDYEGLAIVDQSAYVVRSDGRLYEVPDFMGAKSTVKEYDNHLTADHDVEGLGYDKKNNRLLLAIKGREPNKSIDYKGIYAFDLTSKTLMKNPVYKLDLNDDIFKGVQTKKSDKVMQPSEIQVHPTTNEIFILEGADPKLLVMGADGNNKKLYKLRNTDFPQAEGLTFSPAGEIFISNEGKNKGGTILKIELSDLSK